MNKKTKKNILNEIHKQAENFSHGEEIANFVSHTVGAGLAILAFLILTIRASWTRNILYGIWLWIDSFVYNVGYISRIKARNSQINI